MKVAIGALVLLLGGCQQADKGTAIIEATRAGYTAFQQGNMAAWAANRAESAFATALQTGNSVRALLVV